MLSDVFEKLKCFKMFQVLALLVSGASVLGSKVYSFHYVVVIHQEENVEKKHVNGSRSCPTGKYVCKVDCHLMVVLLNLV